MKKQIIFIGGTERSGSTLISLILANDPMAMSFGEIQALFHPTRKHHFKKIAELKEDNVWSLILKEGKKRLYSNLLKYFPEIDIFIDSSKDPFWINFQSRHNRKNFNVNNILIYKSPKVLANSFIKRDKGHRLHSVYKHYHMKYFSLIDRFISISYNDLVLRDDALIKLCGILDIAYFNTKKNYWEKNQLNFFGSNSVKSKSGHRSAKQLDRYMRKEICYEEFKDSVLTDDLDNILNNDEKIKKIIQTLENHHVLHEEMTHDVTFRYNFLRIYYDYFKQFIKNSYRYYLPQDYFKKND